MVFFVGTLTREGGGGVLRCDLDGAEISLKETLFLTDPNYVISSGNRLFSVSSDAQGEFRGCVNEIDASGVMRVLAQEETGGNAPCFLCTSPDGRYLYCPNYGTGSIAVFPIEGGLKPRIQLIVHSGSGPHPTRQTAPHVHQVLFIPGTQYLCACDLGTDCIEVYKADVQSGLLTHYFTLHLHGGPRHLVFADDTLGYVCHELSNEVTVLAIQDGVLTPMQTISTLPVEVQNTAAAIRLSKNKKKLYVSNRGHGSIALYDVKTDGTLQLHRHWEAGSFPRDFVLLEDERILIADQKSGIRLLGVEGQEVAYLKHIGAVCVC
ncbi:MAG: lactonase family protein [Clostridia bacterium]|nr:lactonase family protein [Clostridia bacterium]